MALEGATVYARKKTTQTRSQVITIKPASCASGLLRYALLGRGAGIDEDWYDGAVVDGIMKLPGSLTPGTDVRPYLGLDDEVWDISVTATPTASVHTAWRASLGLLGGG